MLEKKMFVRHKKQKEKKTIENCFMTQTKNIKERKIPLTKRNQPTIKASMKM